ncbi:RNA polymerase sigma factor, partial [Bacteroidota bacterium]
MDLLSDNELMFMVKSGDNARLGLLYERYKKCLFAYFFRSTNDQTASEDLVQNVFYRMLKYKNSFTGKGKFTTWMYYIAHNVCIDFYKKNNRYNLHEDTEQWSIYDGLSIDEEIVKKEKLLQLRLSLAKLCFPAQFSDQE